MSKLKAYLFTNVSQIFFSIFGTLFLITSVVFLVKIAALTSVIKIDILELVLFYLYTLPKILFYTLPISLFIAFLLSLARLSSEYELIVITSLGLKPSRFVWFLLPISLVFTVMMLIISLGLIPKAEYLNNILLQQKKKEASFNIKASQFGQKFGDWLIYIDKDTKESFEGVKLFKDVKTENAYQFIIADKANAKNHEGQLDLNLKDGKTIRFSTEVNQIDFKQMYISDTLGKFRVPKFEDPISFWKEEIKSSQKDFIFYILFSIFPLISLPLVVAFGYYNPRYEKNHTTRYGIIITLVYTSIIVYGSKNFGLDILWVTPIVVFIVDYLAYQIKIKKLY